MALNLFKKKEEDDFSDFTKPMRTESSSLDDGIFPRSADITDVSGNNKNLGLPDDNEVHNVSSPTSFSEFNNMKSQKAFIASQNSDFSANQSNNTSSADHQPTRIELMTKVSNIEKDMQIINAKVDSVRSILETISHRLTNIEKASEPKKEVIDRDEIRW
jgi:hypothetical protein